MTAAPPDPNQAPGAFSLDKLVMRKVALSEVDQASKDPGEQRPGRVQQELTIGGHIRWDKGLHAIVSLDITVEPDPKWQPYKIQVVVAASFTGHRVSPEDFNLFCKNGVPSILFPYVREMVHTVSKDGLYGVVTLDPINIAALLKQSEWGQDTDLLSTSTEPGQPASQ